MDQGRKLSAYIEISVIAIAICFFMWLNDTSKQARNYPEKELSGPIIYHVDSHHQIYAAYKRQGLWGAKVIHLNRFLNMVDYLPKEENITMPFPVKVSDVRPLYEKGLDSHNWLFIANRTGLVRSAIIVLPDAVFLQRRSDFESDFAYRVHGGVITGYSQDMPLMITTLNSMGVVNEPVIVNVDAGYFGWAENLSAVVETLREKCPDIRMVVFSSSLDETEVPDLSRDRLTLFENLWVSHR